MDKSIKTFLRNSLKPLTGYAVAFIVFGIFSFPIINIFKNNIGTSMKWYSFIVFLIMVSIIYSDMRDIAFKEKRPQYNINPKPYKGLFYGLVASIPLYILSVIYLLIQIPGELIQKRKILQAILCPLYWFAKLLGNEYWCYLVSILLIPIITLLGYLAGHYNINIVVEIKKPVKKVWVLLKKYFEKDDI